MKLEKVIRIVKDIQDIDLAVSFLQSQITKINETEYEEILKRIEDLENKDYRSPHDVVLGG